MGALACITRPDYPFIFRTNYHRSLPMFAPQINFLLLTGAIDNAPVIIRKELIAFVQRPDKGQILGSQVALTNGMGLTVKESPTEIYQMLEPKATAH
jgi:hypothetical protein